MHTRKINPFQIGKKMGADQFKLRQQVVKTDMPKTEKSRKRRELREKYLANVPKEYLKAVKKAAQKEFIRRNSKKERENPAKIKLTKLIRVGELRVPDKNRIMHHIRTVQYNRIEAVKIDEFGDRETTYRTDGERENKGLKRQQLMQIIMGRGPRCRSINKQYLEQQAIGEKIVNASVYFKNILMELTDLGVVELNKGYVNITDDFSTIVKRN